MTYQTRDLLLSVGVSILVVVAYIGVLTAVWQLLHLWSLL
jgi:hypothetical protein